MKVFDAIERAKEKCIRDNYLRLAKLSNYQTASKSERLAMMVIECGLNPTSLNRELKKCKIEL